MVTANCRRGFTLVELLIVIVVLVIMIVLLVPLIQTQRETARRAACVNNLKALGLGLHNHHDAKKRFATSCILTGKPGERVQNGWSWLTLIKPFIECDPLYDELEIKENPVPGEKTVPLGYNTEDVGFLCPSYSGPKFAFPNKNPPAGALTNYKAIGATHHGSLAQAEGGGGSPAAKYEGNHPDGPLYPGVWAEISAMSDGTSNTVMVCETVEQKEAVWCMGSTATLVGLPPSVSYDIPVAYGGYWAPTGFNGNYDEEGRTSHLPTYLRWDYDRDGPYLSKQYRKGPGSEHPGVVNHLFGDGTVHSLSKQIDAAMYFFLITRANGDPGSEYTCVWVQ